MPPASGSGSPRPNRPLWRRILSWTLTGLALVLVYGALLFPNRVFLLDKPGAFTRIPVEGVVGAAVLLVLPGRLRSIVATVAGVLLGLITIFKCLDMGFFEVLARPFNVIFDWSFFGNGYDFVNGEYGKAAAIGATVGVLVLIVAVLTLMTLAVRRLASALAGFEPHSTKLVAAAAVVWFVAAGFGTVIPGLPQNSNLTAPFAYNTLKGVPVALADHREFARELNQDAFAGQPLLAGLKGKDVTFTFIESYGRSAVEMPDYAPQVDAVLDQGTAELKQAGFSVRSGWLTSPTYGGGSWLAHSTLYSGLWINNEARYRSLVGSDRLTLTGAFKKGDWRSVGVMPGLTGYWPEGKFYGFDKIYDARNLGYGGPKFSWASTPDQWLYSALQKNELAKTGDRPVMAEIETTTSHAPWSYTPKLVDWDRLGDGTSTRGANPNYVQGSTAQVREKYRKTIEYSLKTFVSYVHEYLDENQVIVMLGDHQPISLVSGQNASHDVPITIIAKDPKVAEKIASWGWTDSLNPGRNGPVWKMDAFRDKFLTAFSS
ncbi:sulfatase [Cryptosporangium sp. NPDC051539]|uniref:sulfatase n=1 Tax=Cryptosporangium sp. NPDC051539 TaxID=3363962 RepID=UPI00379BFCA3